jgi:hypothetical protein
MGLAGAGSRIETHRRVWRLASLTSYPRMSVRKIRDREVDREALKDGGVLGQSQNPPVSPARDPRAAKDQRDLAVSKDRSSPRLSQSQNESTQNHLASVARESRTDKEPRDQAALKNHGVVDGLSQKRRSQNPPASLAR